MDLPPMTQLSPDRAPEASDTLICGLWKRPLRQYIEILYFNRFDKERPNVVLSIEEKIRLDEAKKTRRREP